MTAAGSSGDRGSRAAVALPPADDELLVLIGRLCDGVLSRGECTRLETLMRGSAQAIDVYCAAVELNAALQWRWHTPRWPRGKPAAMVPATPSESGEAAGSGAAITIARPDPEPAFRPAATGQVTTPQPPQPSPRAAEWDSVAADLAGPRWRLLGVIQALLAAVFIGGLFGLWRAGPLGGWGFQPRRLPGSVACVTGLHDAAWEQPEDGTEAAALRPYASLFAGQRFDLVRGLVEITFDGGATTLIEGPATFEVVSLTAGRLSTGRLTATLDKAVAKAAGAGSRFAIETPTATVTDLGTSFGVAVDAAGETSVRVFDGLVELLPRLAGDVAAAKPLRLAAGESAGVAIDRAAKRDAGTKRIAFTRAIPGRWGKRASPLPFAWDESGAVSVFRDSFAGAGGLAGSTPASRGGVGQAAWVAPGGWQLNAAADGLAASSPGAALLPFTPEPGHRYRVSVTIEIADGGFGWASLGFATSADPRQPRFPYPWKPGSGEMPVKFDPQKPEAATRPTTGDRLRGIQNRTLILDTTGPAWRLVSLAGETLVGERVYETPPVGISHVGVSIFPNTAAVLRGFTLESVRVVP